jgi:predicted ester cyclase
MDNSHLNLLRQVVEEGFGNADLYVIDQIMSDHLVEHQFGLHGGKEGLKKAILSLAEAFSDRNYELVHHAIDRNMVWVHYRYTATHTGPFMGHAPTHKKITIDVMDIAKIEDGKITEHWGVPDRFAVMMQLGFLEPSKSKV